MGPLLLWQNYAQLGGTLIAASSEYPTMPARRLRYQTRSDRWRSASGWTVIVGFNDSVDVEMGAVPFVAIIAEGTYTTGDEMAVAVKAALDEAFEYVAGTWSVTYSATTHAFTITHDTTAFTLLWSSGANVSSSCGRDLGFDVAADTGSALAHAADGASYQSRHYLTFDLRGPLGVRAAIAFDHNSEQGGTYTAQAADSAAAALTDPELVEALDSTGYLETFRACVFDEALYQYWAIVIDDVANADGFVELGVAYLGSYLEIDYLARGLERSPIDYSGVAFADQGAHFQDRKQASRLWTPSFEAQARSVVEAVDAMFASVLTGGALFFIPEPDVLPLRVLYGFLTGPPEVKHRAGDSWDIALKFQEALG